MKINIGSGVDGLEGYENVDSKFGDKAYPLDFPNDCADEIRASHVLEHFPYSKVLHVLMDWTRVLAPGGTLKIAVPDLHQIATRYLAGEQFNVLGYIFGGQTDADDYHYCAFDEQVLTQALEACGLTDIQHWESDAGDCSSLEVSLNLMGKKPVSYDDALTIPVMQEEEPYRLIVPMDNIARDVVGIMSAPRLGFMDMFESAMKSLVPLGVQFYRGGGAFWGQSLTKLMEDVLELASPKYILTMDYDTVFNHEDVEHLYALMETQSHADAICALQMSRHHDSPLFATQVVEGTRQNVAISYDDLMQELLKVRTGHFGLTIIRVESLKKLTKPWFWSTPDAEGRWGEGKIDDDIHFWHQWERDGFSLYVAPRVVVGHLELLINWPSQRLKSVFQGSEKYAKFGKPEGIWK